MSNAPLQNDQQEYSGLFINEATIKSARSVSNEDIYKNEKPVDVGIEMELEIGKTFFPKITIAGNLNLAETGNKMWGSAMKVKIFLSDMRVKWKELNPDNSIPQDVLDQLTGLKIMRLQYPAKRSEEGKIRYNTYNRVVLASFKNKEGLDAKAFLKMKYEADVAGGYVKPLADEGTSFDPAKLEAEAPATY